LCRIDVDADRFETARTERPSPERHLEARADADHEIRARPKPIGLRDREPELMRIAHDAAARSKRNDRRIDRFCKLEHLAARLDRATSDKNDRRPALPNQPRRPLDALG